MVSKAGDFSLFSPEHTVYIQVSVEVITPTQFLGQNRDEVPGHSLSWLLPLLDSLMALLA